MTNRVVVNALREVIETTQSPLERRPLGSPRGGAAALRRLDRLDVAVSALYDVWDGDVDDAARDCEDETHGHADSDAPGVDLAHLTFDVIDREIERSPWRSADGGGRDAYDEASEQAGEIRAWAAWQMEHIGAGERV